MTLTLTQMSPAVGATGVSQTAQVSCRVEDPDPPTVKATSIGVVVTISGQPAENAVVEGVVQSGYSGTVKGDQAGDVSIDLSRDAGWPLGAVVRVDVSASNTNGESLSYGFIWQFTIGGTPATVSPSTVEKDGGYRLTISGLSVPDGSYGVWIGTTGTPADAAAYAGQGLGYAVTVTGGQAECVSPPLPSGGPYLVYVSGASGVELLASGGPTYVNKVHRSGRHSIRSALLPWWRTGPRSLDEEPEQ